MGKKWTTMYWRNWAFAKESFPPRPGLPLHPPEGHGQDTWAQTQNQDTGKVIVLFSSPLPSSSSLCLFPFLRFAHSLDCLLLVSSWKEKNDSTFPCVLVLLSMLSEDSPPLKLLIDRQTDRYKGLGLGVLKYQEAPFWAYKYIFPLAPLKFAMILGMPTCFMCDCMLMLLLNTAPIFFHSIGQDKIRTVLFQDKIRTIRGIVNS